MSDKQIFKDTNHHHHDHHFLEDTKRNRKRLKLILGITLVYMVIEYIGGYLSNSLALMSDATHMLADVTALGLTLGSFYLSTIPPNENNTFGLKRIEILVGFINGLFLLLLASAIIWAGIERYINPPEVKGFHMIGIATTGLLVNIIAGFILFKGHHDNLAMRSAFLHIVGDAISSIGAIIAGILVLYFDLKIADPIASIFVGSIIAISAFRLVKDSAHIILQGVPYKYNIEAIQTSILQLEKIISIHDLHLWSLNSGQSILTVHVVIANLDNYHEVLEQVREVLLQEHQIEHSTVQLEINQQDCPVNCC